VKTEGLQAQRLAPRQIRAPKIRAAHNLGLRGEIHNQELLDMMTLVSIRPDDPDIQLDQQSEEESSSDSSRPLLAMEVDEDEAEEELAIPYQIVGQGRTSKALGSRLKYKVRWCDENGEGMEMKLPGAWSWEMAENIEQDVAYIQLVRDWKENRPNKFNKPAWQVL
jgi:hypothetical protein